MTVKTQRRVAGERPVLLSAFVEAVQTLTRLPVPDAGPPTSRTTGWSAVLYPLVGFLLGLAGIAVHQVTAGIFPRVVAALLILALWMLLTGALHEDGLADAFDAFASQGSRHEVLRVMKDSRIGAFGALALGISLLLRWQTLALLPAAQMAAALVACQVLPRAGIVVLAYVAGPASEGSGGALAACLRRRHVVLSVVMAAAIVLLFGGWRAMMTMGVVCAGIVAASIWYFRRRIGGVTGDCLGATNQMQEVGVLVALLAS